MTLERYITRILPAIEKELVICVSSANGTGLGEFHHMLAYHLGWEGEGAGPEARGKRIRPVLLLLTTAACGAEWERALPAAASVELIHNFSLIHDDIEDNSPTRRGRPTLWKKWGIPQAINTGDAMFTLAHMAMLRLADNATPEIAFKASNILHETCLRLTQGQFLDISYETRGDLTLDAYWSMVSGKTAALLAACAHIGALIAGADEEIQSFYHQFAWSLGLAFQAQDDLLGIWGDSAVTGKSVESDLVSGKKSLPVLYGLKQGREFARRWYQGPITSAEAPQIASLLEHDGARNYTLEQTNKLTSQALNFLQQASPQGDAGAELHSLALELLGRQG
jgi:geranylgeranyl diphosphate synthase type I